MHYAPPIVQHCNNWIDLPDAADYAGVGYSDIVDAITARELTAITTHPRRPGDWLVRMHDVDAWVARRSAIPAEWLS